MIHSFLMIGQSNMAGRGLLDEAETIDTAHIKILRNGRWQPMFRPINPDRPFSGVNLAESFAEQYAQTYGVDVGLIPCADGGTSLEQWQPGGLLFDHAVYSARLAQRTSTIAGLTNAFTYLGSALSGWGLGWIAGRYGWGVVNWVLAGLCVLGCAICLAARPLWRRFTEAGNAGRA